jgi:hypothetical protein
MTSGREWFDRVVADPDNLADHPVVLAQAAGSVEEWALRDPAGEGFDVDDDAQLSRRLPRLAALFRSDDQ